MGIITKLNDVKSELIKVIDEADIKNLDNRSLKVVDVGLTRELSYTFCPIVAVYKSSASGNSIHFDQTEAIEIPNSGMINIAIADFSQISLDDAEKKSDDLLDKIITLLNENPSLNGKVSKISIHNITFDEARDEGIFYSIPEVELMVELPFEE